MSDLENELPELPADCDKRIAEAARSIAAEFGHSDPDDLIQAVWLWILESPKRQRPWWYESKVFNEEGEPILKEDGEQKTEPKFSWRQFRRDIRRVSAEYARRDKRARLGLVAEDEVNYSRPTIERYLVYRWHTEVLAAMGGVEDDGPKAQVDKATTGDAMASALDVRTAYDKVITAGSDWDETMHLVYGWGFTQQEAADALGVAQNTVSVRITRAIEAIAQSLNGTQGGREYADDGPGTKHIMSNAQARSLTSSYEN